MYNHKLIEKEIRRYLITSWRGLSNPWVLAVPPLFLQCIIPSSKCSISGHVLRWYERCATPFPCHSTSSLFGFSHFRSCQNSSRKHPNWIYSVISGFTLSKIRISVYPSPRDRSEILRAKLKRRPQGRSQDESVAVVSIPTGLSCVPHHGGALVLDPCTPYLPDLLSWAII